MERDFASIMVQPVAVRCIGVPLRAFSLGHLLILRQMESAFIVGGKLTYPDFIASTFVCVHSWAENQKLFTTPFRRWLKCKIWAALAGPFNVPIQIQVLAEYIKTARETPEQKAPKAGATMRYLHSDWDTRLYKFLRSINIGREEALDMPLAVANALFIAQLEEDEKADFKVLRDDPITRALAEALEQGEREFPA